MARIEEFRGAFLALPMGGMISSVITEGFCPSCFFSLSASIIPMLCKIKFFSVATSGSGDAISLSQTSISWRSDLCNSLLWSEGGWSSGVDPPQIISTRWDCFLLLDSGWVTEEGEDWGGGEEEEDEEEEDNVFLLSCISFFFVLFLLSSLYCLW